MEYQLKVTSVMEFHRIIFYFLNFFNFRVLFDSFKELLEIPQNNIFYNIAWNLKEFFNFTPRSGNTQYSIL